MGRVGPQDDPRGLLQPGQIAPDEDVDQAKCPEQDGRDDDEGDPDWVPEPVQTVTLAPSGPEIIIPRG